MSKIGPDEVRRIAALANIGLSDDEVSGLAAELGQIVEFVEQLQSVKTSDTVETSQVTGLVDVWREDEVKSWPGGREELLKNAPDRQDGYIKVRRVLE